MSAEKGAEATKTADSAAKMREYPLATVTKHLVKPCLPEGTNLQKDASLALHRASFMFVSYLGIMAQDAMPAKVKTMKPEHILNVLKELELEFMLPELNEFAENLAETRAAKQGIQKEPTGDEKLASLLEKTGITLPDVSDIHLPGEEADVEM
ncbi:DNA polymerase epsilon subunit D, POLE3 [Carpediemonas membranifera]|uniref:DNA polymerase epsilon subunit D, POLE3 n=1 Tax=Carpediemonas membranifera TaxID=201153 RepID=A0A8J6BBM6_9EUKA|nr:DNA polymerase epsilon subunit D, POLE3 [Carpediemonas membranifera]|eukprot:KAG9397379.1 DNA polymerase epsilon subunit D, POLE3 [Carpediemonas membranifera]